MRRTGGCLLAVSLLIAVPSVCFAEFQSGADLKNLLSASGRIDRGQPRSTDYQEKAQARGTSWEL